MKKRCSKCAIKRPLDAFFRDRSKPGGIYSSCKDCARALRGNEKLKPKYRGLKGQKLRRCGGCNRYLKLNNFYSNKSTKDGLHTSCKPCTKGFSSSETNLQSRRNRRQYIRGLVLTAYGGTPAKCSCCGESHKEFLSIDHINGGGEAHRRSIKTDFYRWLIKEGYPNGFRVLCRNCNSARGYYGACPHEYETNTKGFASRDTS